MYWAKKTLLLWGSSRLDVCHNFHKTGNVSYQCPARSQEKSYLNLNSPNVYQTYDFAQFLKNNEKFEKALTYKNLKKALEKLI